MITKRTTFVLGAGASMAYGFPSGKTLKALIWRRLSVEPSKDWNKLTFPEYFYKAAGCQPEDIGKRQEFEKKVQEFCQHLSLSPDETIDYFLEHVGDNESVKNEYRLIGRLAIADVLLEREKCCYLFQDWMKYESFEKEHQQQGFVRNNYIRPKDGHWYRFLFNQMSRKCPDINEFTNNKIAVVTFNYDRSFEYYFLCALMSKYKVNAQKAAEVLRHFNIAHVYGQLGQLPELEITRPSKNKDETVPYEALSETNSDKFVSLKNAADGVQLIWDDPEENQNIQRARELLFEKNSQVIFLGFGYDPINLRRIIPNNKISDLSTLKGYGTILGISKQRLQDLRGRYKIKVSPQLEHSWFGQSLHGALTDDFKECTIYEFLYNSIGLLT